MHNCLLNENSKTMVEVFSTNIKKQKQADLLLSEFKKQLSGYEVHFDLEDCDNILRVETKNTPLEIDKVVDVVVGFGFNIEVLPDKIPLVLNKNGIKYRTV